jgi:predicted Kef-type K+ transport protein
MSLLAELTVILLFFGVGLGSSNISSLFVGNKNNLAR